MNAHCTRSIMPSREKSYVASSDELIGSGAVENDAAFELLCHSECDSAGEVGADHTS